MLAWVVGDRALGAMGVTGLGWVVGFLVFVTLVEPLLGARKRIDAWRKGSAGEERTEVWLRELPAEFVVLHDLAIPGSKANIDHLVVGPTGVFFDRFEEVQGDDNGEPSGGALEWKASDDAGDREG